MVSQLHDKLNLIHYRQENTLHKFIQLVSLEHTENYAATTILTQQFN